MTTGERQSFGAESRETGMPISTMSLLKAEEQFTYTCIRISRITHQVAISFTQKVANMVATWDKRRSISSDIRVRARSSSQHAVETGITALALHPADDRFGSGLFLFLFYGVMWRVKRPPWTRLIKTCINTSSAKKGKL